MVYETPKVHVNGSSWGPTNLPEQFVDLPYAPYGKGDKLGKAADFTANANYYNQRGTARFNRDSSGVNAEFQYHHDAEEDASFQLVDTTKTLRPKTNRLRSTWNQRFNNRNFQQKKGQEDSKKSHPSQYRPKGQQKLNKRWNRLNKARRLQNTRKREEQTNERVASVDVQATWKLVSQFELAQMTKLQANKPTVEDLKWCGELRQYDDAYDRVNTRADRRLKKYEDRDFFYVSTTEDPVLDEYAQKKEATVFATDAILAHLMSSPRSVYPWDIVVERVNDMVFFDKRDASKLDFVTVNETAFETPSSDDPNSINHPDRLSLEATLINQNFSQQILKEDDSVKKDLDEPNPFATDDAPAASIGYRYRKFNLGESLNLITRSELNGYAVKRSGEQLIAAYALNEWDSKLAGGVDWRKKIDSQRGAVLSTELKNNSCKLAKWTSQAMLAGVDQIKLGYVSRVNSRDAYNHSILGVTTYNPKDFALQIALNQNNMWGIIKMLAELMLEQPEGKYVIMRDPQKPVVRIYNVPMDSFEDEADEDDEDDDDNDMLDDLGEAN